MLQRIQRAIAVLVSPPATQNAPTATGDRNPYTTVINVCRLLVDDPDVVRIRVHELPLATVIDILVAPQDMGKIVGRQGAIIGAIRTLVNSIIGRGRVKTVVNVVTVHDMPLTDQERTGK